MDRIEKAVAPSVCIRFAFTELTMASKALEARHLCGPTAAMALAEGLAGAALLSVDAGSGDESFMLRVNASGPIGGLLAEATGMGGLRGFTHRKVLDELDTRDEIETTEAWGRSGFAQIVTSIPGKILNQAVMNVNPPLINYVLARYFNHSLQVPTGCAIRVTADSGGLISARGLLAQRMEDSDPQAFVRVLEQFENSRVKTQLAGDGSSAAIGISAFRDIFGLADLRVHETRPLMFACRCSRERMLNVLETLSVREIEALVAAESEQGITCHMCGKTYTATVTDMRSVLVRLR